MNVSFAQRGNVYDENDKNALLNLLGAQENFNKWDVIREFESEFHKYIGNKYAVSMSSGTAALHLCLKAIGIEPGDEVITTPMTWVATSNVVMLEGAIPVFVDVEPDTINIDSKKIVEKITSRTRAILVVHFAGHSVDLDEIMKIAEKHNLVVIGDAAHAPGSLWHDKKIGAVEHLTAFSFYTQKNISTLGEGGMIVTDNEEYYKKIKLLQNHGVIYRNNQKNASISKQPWYRDCRYVGYNYRMSEAQAVVGISQLAKLDIFNAKRRALADYYNELLKNMSGIQLPVEKYYATSSWHFYIIKIEDDFGISRDELFIKLKKIGIETSVHYTPLHYFIPYKELGYNHGDFPVAEDLYRKVLSLPLHLGMNEALIQFVVEGISSFNKKIIK